MHARSLSRRRIITSGLIIFLVAFGLRLLAWQDNRDEARKVQSAVTEGYKHTARLLRENGFASFFSPSSPLSDPNHLGHPPGYSIVLAFLPGTGDDMDAAVQLLQITCDSLAAVVVFLFAGALLSPRVATVAGILVALAPQFTYNSTLLLPDTLSVLPILLALYCVARMRARSSLVLLLVAGALIGVSCWLRANAMLLAPFMALAMPLVFERGKRLRSALALMAGMLLIVVPLSVRNAIVYRHFVPVSLGAGQTLLEGIGDYDPAGRLGIPSTDMGIMKMEAELYGRPDYYGMLFNPDGIQRERLRLKRGFSIILKNPFWFAGVMVRRGAGMLRLERVRVISPEPPVSHSLAPAPGTLPIWSAAPDELLKSGTILSTEAAVSLDADGQTLAIRGDDSKYGDQFASAPVIVRRDTDYLLQLPVRIEQGRMNINITGAGRSTPYASAIIEPQDWKAPAEQPVMMIQLPFVSRADGELRIVFAGGGGAQGTRPLIHAGPIELYALGPTTQLWTRYPRAIANAVQRSFITAVMLPLALYGLFLLVRRKERRALVLLLVVPAYYLCFQSMLHTEYRYVLAIHYFLFVAVALALCTICEFLWPMLLKLRRGLPKLPLARRLRASNVRRRTLTDAASSWH